MQNSATMYALFGTFAVAFLLRAAEGSVKNQDLYLHRVEERESERYTSSWAVEIVEGGDKMADKIASKHGFRNLGRVCVHINVAYSYNLCIYLLHYKF